MQEADIDDDSEQNLVVDWDQDAADEAYKAEVEAAQRLEEERLAAEAAWLEVGGRCKWVSLHAWLLEERPVVNSRSRPL